MKNFELFTKNIAVDTSKKVIELEVTLEIKDYKGTVNITDILLQGGTIITIWTGHPSEMRWSNDF